MNDKSELLKAVDAEDYLQLVSLVPYADYLGMKINRHTSGLQYLMPFREALLGNPVLPSLHGGVIAGFMENAALIEVLIKQRQNRIPKPVDFSIDYLRPGRAQQCQARVEVVREGKRIVLARVDCWQDSEDALIAQVRMHFLLEESE